MAKTLDILSLIDPDMLSRVIGNYWVSWDMLRNLWKTEKQEIRKYIFATDTTTTTNNKLPWSNKTTIPKLCQIRDNLLANYQATMFPKRKWLDWEASSEDDNDKAKTDLIKNYMMWNVEQLSFKETISKLVQDYVDYGNCFATVEWIDQTLDAGKGVIKSGFTGARPVRIDPYNLVFNPTSTSFAEAPKIIRSVMSIGEAKKTLNKLTKTPEEKVIASAVFDQLMEFRTAVSNLGMANFKELDEMYNVDGFTSYQNYLTSNFVELLTFYGDLYDRESDTLLENHMIVVMDRVKVIFKAPHPYPLAEIPIYRAGWRERQDNLWAMGPLDNLVGMQYRLDHVENMKADLLDLTTFPPLKIKGIVGDFEWGPMEKIFTDSDGDVELMTPDTNVAQVNMEIQRYEQLMEEMAGAPKEAMGFRTPGEKTAYEVQHQENASSRIFNSKVSQFEEALIEPLLNAMLVYAKQYLTPTTIRVLDGKFNTVDFSTIQASDLAANGRLKPIAARHFAEMAQTVQNISNFAASPLYADQAINVHFSGLKIAKMMEETLEIEDYEIVIPYVRLSEMAEAQQLQNTHQEQVQAVNQAPSGLTPDDHSGPPAQGALNLPKGPGTPVNSGAAAVLNNVPPNAKSAQAQAPVSPNAP